MLMKALQDNIQKFESRFGEIKFAGPANPQFGFSNINNDEKIN
jgi:hypothetical protein